MVTISTAASHLKLKQKPDMDKGGILQGPHFTETMYTALVWAYVIKCYNAQTLQAQLGMTMILPFQHFDLVGHHPQLHQSTVHV
jgi:hypothetical protein